MSTVAAHPCEQQADAELHRMRELTDSGEFAQALQCAQSALLKAPDNRDALYLMAVNQRRLQQFNDALATLHTLEQKHPQFGLLFQERGLCYRSLGKMHLAILAYEHAVLLNDTLTASWHALQQLYQVVGRSADAERATHCLTRLARLPPELVSGANFLNEGDLDAAERVIRGYLQKHGNHVEGMRLLAQLAIKHDVMDDAEFLLSNIVAMAPDYRDARYEYAIVLAHRRHHMVQLEQAKILLQAEPNSRRYLKIYAQACDGLGKYEEALRVYRRLLTECPEDAELSLLTGHALRTCGKQSDAIEAYYSAIAAKPNFGFAFVALANMKTYKFSSDELASMRAHAEHPDTSLLDRCHLCFAIGKALEDRNEYAESFQYYERGNALKRSTFSYDADATKRAMHLQISVCTKQFFETRKNVGCSRPDPIFILGLPRSGSTLIEQILASHSKVDGTMELPFIPRIAHQFRDRNNGQSTPRYPGILAELTADELRSLGEIYIEDTMPYRKRAPFFIDKMPANFREIGLIQLILPNAKIIDARRAPMACCFGNFKQLFTRGQEFTYRLEDLGRYYRNYVELMDHWDQVLPGRVLRVQHEELVDDLEGSVHRILDYCGLEFESACIEFYKTARSVRTVSSEQVRQPIYREGISLWRHYEPWLEPLKLALGPLAPSG